MKCAECGMTMECILGMIKPKGQCVACGMWMYDVDLGSRCIIKESFDPCPLDEAEGVLRMPTAHPYSSSCTAGPCPVNLGRVGYMRRRPDMGPLLHCRFGKVCEAALTPMERSSKTLLSFAQQIVEVAKNKWEDRSYMVLLASKEALSVKLGSVIGVYSGDSTPQGSALDIRGVPHGLPMEFVNYSGYFPVYKSNEACAFPSRFEVIWGRQPRTLPILPNAVPKVPPER